ncbi:MAG: arsenic transporter [Lachnospiraceae bacterium]|nr:arsenic transporter [Lachnospiraceae bacterium]
MIFALILFIITYVLMLIFDKYRPYIAIGSALIFILSGMLPFKEIPGSTNIPADLNVLLMIAGTMGLVALFTESKMPDLLADIIIEKVPNVKWAVVALSLFAGVISAFVDNVSTVLMIAPVALLIAKKLKINPVPMIISIAVSSNLQGAATLVGDTTAIMLGSYANMNFMNFFWYKGKLSIFFAVELGALLSAAILLVMFRKETATLPKQERTKVKDYVPTWLLCGAVLLLIIASFVPIDFPETINGIICCSMFVVGIIYTLIKRKGEAKQVLIGAFKEIDFNTIGLLFGLFLVIAGINNMGVIEKIAELLSSVGGNSVFLIYTVIVWGSVLFSAFIDNIPYVATMLPVIQGLALKLGIDPTVLYFGLLSGATLGGNLTPIGASANITGINILKKEGCTVKNSDFFKIGIPFTLAAIIPAYIYIWLVYGI